YCISKTSLLGDLLLVAEDEHLIGVYFSGRNHDFPVKTTGWTLDPKHPVLQEANQQIEGYLDGSRKQFSLPIHFGGTDFQHEIWKQISLIPFGETISYSELAKRAGAPSAVRAAGAATGRNPISIVVPCHRIVGKDGAMRGFGGGLDRKRKLLGIEGKMEASLI
ncbi:MAG TPA: methylated-DNA--[protein]-cysteine S-methyltransferase, partial [Chthoniobacteraceae bacterium]